MKFEHLDSITDDELRSRVKRWVASERQCTAQLIHHLVEIRRRELHLADGCSDLFYDCRDILGFNEDEAHSRAKVAEAAGRFPVVLDLPASGALRMTAVRHLAKHLTAENHRELLEAASFKTLEQVDVLIAHLAPKPDVADSSRRVGNSPCHPIAS
jgi:hypothetical protein